MWGTDVIPEVCLRCITGIYLCSTVTSPQALGGPSSHNISTNVPLKPTKISGSYFCGSERKRKAASGFQPSSPEHITRFTTKCSINSTADSFLRQDQEGLRGFK